MNLRKTLLATLFSLSVAGMAQASAPTAIDFKVSAPFEAASIALPGHDGKPMVVVAGGKVMAIDGQLLLANGRVAIGAVSEEGRLVESTGSSRPDGALDLSKPYVITVKVAEVKSLNASKDNFFIYVNNSTSRQGDSPLGRDSLLVKVSASDLKVGDNVFKGKIGDAKSFLQLRAESGAQVNIESITIAAQ
jgi:hypothetical protein